MKRHVLAIASVLLVQLLAHAQPAGNPVPGAKSASAAAPAAKSAPAAASAAALAPAHTPAFAPALVQVPAPLPVPVTIATAAPVSPSGTTAGILISDTPSFYLDSLHTTRGGSIQDIATVRNKTFAASWSRWYDRLMNHPRPYVFWVQAGLRNDADSAQELSLAYGNLDFVDVWLIPGASSGPARSRSSSQPQGSALLPVPASTQPSPPGGPHTSNSANFVPGQPPSGALRPMSPQYVSAGELRPPPKGSSYLQRRSGTIPLRLPPHTSATLLVRVRQLTDDYSFDGFALYDQARLSAGIVKDLPADTAFLVIQMLFQGFLICQLLYVLVQWFIINRPEYWYYFLYMLLIAGYFLSKQEALFGVRLLFTRWPPLRIYLGKTLLVLPYFVYFRFVRSFLDFPRDYPRLNYWVIRLEYFLLAYALVDFVFILLTFNRGMQTLVYTVVFSIVFLISMGFTIYLVRYRQPLIYFILAGSLFVATGHILGLVFSYLEVVRHLDLGVPDIFVFPQSGIVLEILCFTAGLSYKNKKIEQEKISGQEKLIEQLKANELLQARMQHIRNKIAQDLHDDIGSTLSSISILSDLAIRGNSSSQTLETMGEIKDSSLMLMERMDDIVWSINPRNDSLENLLVRVRHFATTLFEARGIDYTIDIAKNIHEVRLPMDYRQHIYLILKEAINNLVKYAHATEAFIEVRFDHRHLTLCVRDNGCGFDPAPPPPCSGGKDSGSATSSGAGASSPSTEPSEFGSSSDCPGNDNGFGTGELSSGAGPSIITGGNGLPGIFHRASLMDARVEITSAPGQGTSIRLQVDLA